MGGKLQSSTVGTLLEADIHQNTAVGQSALGHFVGGGGNTAVGALALSGDTSSTGGANTAIGYQALFADEAGSNNIALGSFAGGNVTSGNGNIFIGGQTAQNVVTGSNNIYIGNPAETTAPPSGDESNVIRIGDIQTAMYLTPSAISEYTGTGMPAPLVIDVNGQLWTQAGTSPSVVVAHQQEQIQQLQDRVTKLEAALAKLNLQ